MAENINNNEKPAEVKLPRKLLVWVNITLILANLAIFTGVFLAISSYFLDSENYANQRQFAKQVEMVNNAMDAINRFYNVDFINFSAILKTPSLYETPEYEIAENYVFNTYYVITLVYKSKIADNKIIGEAISSEFSYYITHEPFLSREESKEKSEISEMYRSILTNTRIK